MSRSFAAGVIAGVIVLDQASKALARNHLAAGEVQELAPVLNLTLGYNRGVAFGLFSGTDWGPWPLIVATSIITIGLLVWIGRERTPGGMIAPSLIAGGAIGNLIDRLLRGGVTDFLDLQLGHRHWPTFNLADAAIVLGVAVLLWLSMRPHKPKTPIESGFTPAAGRPEWSGLYDVAIALLTREQAWRGALLAQASPVAGETILDVGCGTGTFAIMLARAAPDSDVIGLDPDADILDRARNKAARLGTSVTFQIGFARDADDAGGPFDKVVSSLVFHQVPIEEKRAGFAAICASLRPGGSLHVADYGLQRTPLMRALFRQIQRLDGFENTEPNAQGILPQLMTEAGFIDVQERHVIQTLTGSISIYEARRPLS